MTIIAYRDHETGQYPVSDFDVRQRFNGGLPADLTQAEFDLLGIDPVFAIEPPAYDPATHTALEGAPGLVGSSWRQTWTVTARPPEPVPASVTMRQAKLQLSRAKILPQANAIIAAIEGQAGEEARIEWESATSLRRDHPLVAALGRQLGLDDAAKDDLFRKAAEIG